MHGFVAPSSPSVDLVNLAVTAVSAGSHDGQLTTCWSAHGGGQWIRFDLGATKTVAGLAVAWYQGNTRRASFDVQTSGNGTSWTTQFSGMSSGSTTQPEPVDFEDVSARSVRIVGHGNTLHRWNSITEVDVYEQ